MEASDDETPQSLSRRELRMLQHRLALGLLAFALIASHIDRPSPQAFTPVSPHEVLTTPPPSEVPVPLSQVELEQPSEVTLVLTERTYMIKPGDTLESIARDHGTTIDRISEDNKIPDKNRVFSGERLVVRLPAYLEPYLFGEKLKKQEREQLKDAIQQRYHDLEGEGRYYNPGELDSTPSPQRGTAHIYGLNPEEERLLQIKSSGEQFDPNKLTCASWFYPLGTKLIVTYTGPPQANWPLNKWERVEVTVTDRGPDRYLFKGQKDVIIDLTPAAARALEPRAGTGLGKISALYVIVQPTELPPWWNEVPLPTQRP